MSRVLRSRAPVALKENEANKYKTHVKIKRTMVGNQDDLISSNSIWVTGSMEFNVFLK